MAGLQSQKMPTQREARKQRKMRQRTDYKRRRDQAGRFSSTSLSVSSRRQIRALKRKTANTRERKTRKTIYSERGALKSQKAIRSAAKRKFVRKNRK